MYIQPINTVHKQEFGKSVNLSTQNVVILNKLEKQRENSPFRLEFRPGEDGFLKALLVSDADKFVLDSKHAVIRQSMDEGKFSQLGAEYTDLESQVKEIEKKSPSIKVRTIEEVAKIPGFEHILEYIA